MELFDTHFVWFGQVLAVSGQKTLALYKNRQVIKSQLYLDSISDEISDKITTVPRLFSEHSHQDEKKHQIMNVHTKWNCLIPSLFEY